MGKIFNALEKFSKERKADAPASPLQKTDWDALMQYDRQTGKLNLHDRKIIKDPATIHRLLANKLIASDGSLSSSARRECEKRRESLRVSLAGAQPKPAGHRAPERPTGASSSNEGTASAGSLTESDWAILMQYDKETDNLFQYDTQSQRLDNRSTNLLRDQETVQRLLDSKMLLPGGWLSEAAKRECARREQALQKTGERKAVEKEDKPKPRQVSQTPEKDKTGQKPAAVKPLKPVETESRRGVPEKKAWPAETAPVPYNADAVDKNLVCLLDPWSYEAEQFKMLRTSILFPISGKAPRSILVTSANPGEGKSFISANLAISIAGDIDRHVLLIDCDLRRPAIHKQFGFGNVPGLSDYLSKGTSLSSLLLRTRVKKLSILPAGQTPPNPAELLSSELMSALLKEVTERYSDRLIIVDSPPPKLTAETAALSRSIDGILLVIKYGGTSRKVTKELIDKLGKNKILGSVVNHFDMGSSGYSSHRAYRKYKRTYNK